VRDPLANPAPLVRSVYAYVAHRIGDGPQAEDVTSDTFERALRYRSSYDHRKGEPITWLVGIARRVIADNLAAAGREQPIDPAEMVGGAAMSPDVDTRVTLAGALQSVDSEARELLALRYGADLTAREIGRLLGKRTNTVEVALHRALARLRTALDGETLPQAPPSAEEAGSSRTGSLPARSGHSSSD
jgi:RNA polymerase sigma-70 factor, ECF subfamily